MSRLRALGVASAVAIATYACGAPRATLNTPASTCFRAIPAATAAVHHRGKLIGVRLVQPRLVRRRLAGVSGARPICLFAFRGPFAAGAVVEAPQRASGRYAIVAVATRSWTEIRAFVTDRLPIRFRHAL